MNAFDSIVSYGHSLSRLGYPFVTVSNEVVKTAEPVEDTVIIWVSGEESTFDQTFNTSEQLFVRESLSKGSYILASGSEILCDLDAQGSTEDQLFAADVFSASLGDDDAAVYEAYGRDILSGLDLNFDFDLGAEYNVEYPVIQMQRSLLNMLGESLRALQVYGLSKRHCLDFHWNYFGRRECKKNCSLDCLVSG